LVEDDKKNMKWQHLSEPIHPSNLISC